MAAGLEKTTRSDEETRRFGAVIGACVRPGDVVLLTGNLGAGKTCLTQGIARGLDIDDYVSSPTFVLVREYQGRLPLYHADLYRLDDIREISMLGMDEYFYGSGITVVEWAEKGEGVLPLECLHIAIEIVDDDTRKLSLSASGESYQELITEIARRDGTGEE